MDTIRIMNSNRTLVFFSNPFGFGTVGTMLAVLDEFIKRGEKRIVYVADETTLQPFGGDYEVKTIKVDQRDLDRIKSVLKSIDNPVVISSQNRFAIKAAKELLIPCAFIDTLTWFWDVIPDWYYDADLYFASNMPNTKSKIKDLKRAYVVPGIFGEGLPRVNKNNELVVYVGGCINPLVSGIPEEYLSLLCLALENYDGAVRVFSDSLSANFISKRVQNTFVKVGNSSRKEFLDIVNSSKYFCATGGLLATMESFKLGTYVSFLPSTNLSQLGLRNLLLSNGVVKNSFERDEISEKFILTSKTSEKEAISNFRVMDKKIYNSASSKAKFVKKLGLLLKRASHVDSKVLKAQDRFISKVGTLGARDIYRILKHEWGF